CALYRTASHYLSKWGGEGSAIMRADFAFLDASYEKTGVRPLLVVDELEAIALDRQHGWTLNGGHLDVLDTLLSLLTRSSARMIGISNIADRRRHRAAHAGAHRPARHARGPHRPPAPHAGGAARCDDRVLRRALPDDHARQRPQHPAGPHPGGPGGGEGGTGGGAGRTRKE